MSRGACRIVHMEEATVECSESGFAQHQVERPAAADVGGGCVAEVSEDVVVVAAGDFTPALRPGCR